MGKIQICGQRCLVNALATFKDKIFDLQSANVQDKPYEYFDHNKVYLKCDRVILQFRFLNDSNITAAGEEFKKAIKIK